MTPVISISNHCKTGASGLVALRNNPGQTTITNP